LNRHAQLLQVIEQDLELDCIDYIDMQQLMMTLYEELMHRNCQQIDDINLRLVALTENIQTRSLRRLKILGALGLNNAGEADKTTSLKMPATAVINAETQGTKVMQQVFAMYPANRRGQVEARWQQLADAVTSAKSLNERNGKLLAMHHDILGQLLDDRHNSNVYSRPMY
jgi:flagella synthesis protein FlgN